MTAPETTSTRPYMLRALLEWCTDNGLTPHIAVRVDKSTQVPMEFVRDGQIVLNISYDATSGLLIGNEYVEFQARFGGKPREIMVPVTHVMAIYARETGQGMAFPPEDEDLGGEMESEAIDEADAPELESEEADPANGLCNWCPCQAMTARPRTMPLVPRRLQVADPHSNASNKLVCAQRK